jgi:hypothetical protein
MKEFCFGILQCSPYCRHLFIYYSTTTLCHVTSKPPGRFIHCSITVSSFGDVVHVVNHDLVDVIMLPARILILHSPLWISQVVV